MFDVIHHNSGSVVAYSCGIVYSCIGALSFKGNRVCGRNAWYVLWHNNARVVSASIQVKNNRAADTA
ncbi:MAG: hypothetical protein BWY70_00665 [Bacteroidetes bacterium ADurb.Bin408]|nr:MAG: hypothetical protein BWY70_00665 [Bacteroidetes bacterium ADurb.Bin408]